MSRLRTLGLLAALLGACTSAPEGGSSASDARSADTPAQPAQPDPAPPEADTADVDGDPYSGESAHVIPFADRTSMGYLLLLPADPSLAGKRPETPTRAQLRELVQASFSDRRNDPELDLLFRLIDTEPHATDIALKGELELPSLDAPDTGAPDPTASDSPEPMSEAEREAAAAKAERERAFDLLGLHIEVLRVGLGEQTTIPSSVLEDPVLTRHLSSEQRASLPGRQWALLLRADYRNQHGLRGLRLHQTLVRVIATRFEALIHDPDTLETMDAETFSARRLRAAAGNVADQLAIVPFPDPTDEQRVRLSTRGMRRFGIVDLELTGLPRDPATLQRATDFLAGLALVLAQEAEVDSSGFAVQIPDLLEVNCALIRQAYAGYQGYVPLCTGSEAAGVHLVERRPQAHDPRDHVVARVVAPRPQSDAPDYDHPQWVDTTLLTVFGPQSP